MTSISRTYARWALCVDGIFRVEPGNVLVVECLRTRDMSFADADSAPLLHDYFAELNAYFLETATVGIEEALRSSLGKDFLEILHTTAHRALNKKLDPGVVSSCFVTVVDDKVVSRFLGDVPDKAKDLARVLSFEVEMKTFFADHGRKIEITAKFVLVRDFLQAVTFDITGAEDSADQDG